MYVSAVLRKTFKIMFQNIRLGCYNFLKPITDIIKTRKYYLTYFNTDISSCLHLILTYFVVRYSGMQ